MNISGYSLGGPVVIPGLVDSRTGKGGDKKFYFFASQEYTDDARASSPLALEHADGRSKRPGTSRRPG